MQLFVVDENPVYAAQALADCHVRKQILETAQILTSIYYHQHGTIEWWMPKPQNYNHPVALAIKDRQQRMWVFSHFISLLDEFEYRFEKLHAYKRDGLFLNYTKAFWPIFGSFSYSWVHHDGFCRMFSNFTPKSDDLVEAYREYYRYKKSVIKNFKYTKREEPAWLNK